MQARHLFSEGEKNVALSRSFKFDTLLGLRGHLALATLSLPETDPQILEPWSCADAGSPGQIYIRAKDFGLEF